jgi:flavin reductase (DIM6/NTAB) family NADH-FMN oxidoreductase RutF
MPVNKDEFRAALSHFGSGVTVVTAKAADGTPRGLTVSAFSSVSLEPPLILVCIEHRASLHDLLKQGEYFAVNILAEDQEVISRRFASRDPDRFSGVGYSSGTTGAPLLDAALAHLECHKTQAYDGGDHTIFLGEVESTTTKEGKPLIYFRGGYAALA